MSFTFRHIDETDRLCRSYPDLETVDRVGRRLVVDHGELTVFGSSRIQQDSLTVIGVGIVWAALATAFDLHVLIQWALTLWTIWRILSLSIYVRNGSLEHEMIIRTALADALREYEREQDLLHEEMLQATEARQNGRGTWPV